MTTPQDDRDFEVRQLTHLAVVASLLGQVCDEIGDEDGYRPGWGIVFQDHRDDPIVVLTEDDWRGDSGQAAYEPLRAFSKEEGA